MHERYRQTDGRTTTYSDMNMSSRSLKIWVEVSSVLSQITRLTDGRTHSVLVAKLRCIQCMQRCKKQRQMCDLIV